MYYLARLEETGISTWLRETGWAFFSALTLHSLSMALVVGISLAINLRKLGVADAVPFQRLQGLLAPMWWGVAAVILSGSLLLLAYPAKALTNPVFYLKLAAVSLALFLTNRLFRIHVDNGIGPHRIPDYTFASLALGAWLVGIGAGRFLAYTHTVLLAARTY